MKRAMPTLTGMAVLRNLAAGRRCDHGLPGGQSFAGGFTGTLAALRRNGWLDGKGEISAAGRALVEAEKLVE